MTLRKLLTLLVLLMAEAFVFWVSLKPTAVRRQANEVIQRIEAYRQQHGHLPDPEDHRLMKELGFEMRVGWHPEYRRFDATRYRITILEGFDGPYWFYLSEEQQWKKGYP